MWSSSPIEEYESEYTRYYFDRRCEPFLASTGVNIHMEETKGETVEKKHSWASGLKTSIVIQEILTLDASLTHTNSIGTTCSIEHSHATDFEVFPDALAGIQGFYKHLKTTTGTDYTVSVSGNCTNENSSHLAIHGDPTQNTHGAPIGVNEVKERDTYIHVDAGNVIKQDEKCTECNVADMTCDGSNCSTEGCAHEPC